MSLGLVIPVRNDQAALTRLLHCAQEWAVFDHVVVVDDGSEVPVVPPNLQGIQTDLIRHETAQGPGPARNRGLAAITTEHVLFFDSDDLLTAELSYLWQDLQGLKFDFCLFRHCDSRQIDRGHFGMMGHDNTLWRQAGMGGKALTDLTEEARAALAQTANYPWNKIWRTQLLRDHKIAYSDTRVHEDIEPHWMGFLDADRILASDRIVALHHVGAGAGRLTNLQSNHRLQVFGPLDLVLTRLQSASPRHSALLRAFLRFAVDLLDWIRGNLDAHWHADLAARRYAFWHKAVPPDLFDHLAQEDPDLGLRLSLQMIQDRRFA